MKRIILFIFVNHLSSLALATGHEQIYHQAQNFVASKESQLMSPINDQGLKLTQKPRINFEWKKKCIRLQCNSKNNQVKEQKSWSPRIEIISNSQPYDNLGDLDNTTIENTENTFDFSNESNSNENEHEGYNWIINPDNLPLNLSIFARPDLWFKNNRTQTPFWSTTREHQRSTTSLTTIPTTIQATTQKATTSQDNRPFIIFQTRPLPRPSTIGPIVEIWTDFDVYHPKQTEQKPWPGIFHWNRPRTTKSSLNKKN